MLLSSSVTLLSHSRFADLQEQLGVMNGMVIANPVQEQDEAESGAIEAATQQALKEAEAQGVKGADMTPFLLRRITELTQGASLKANIALVRHNAKVGAAIAVELSKIRQGQAPTPHSNPALPLNSIPVPGLYNKGEVKTKRPVVVGGMVVDLVARPMTGKPLLPHTSNPGRLQTSPGGVNFYLIIF
jgi:hypothetical protein